MHVLVVVLLALALLLAAACVIASGRPGPSRPGTGVEDPAWTVADDADPLVDAPIAPERAPSTPRVEPS